MRRLVLLLWLCLLACEGGGLDGPGPAGTSPVQPGTLVYVVNEETYEDSGVRVLPDHQVVEILRDVQLQLDNEFRASWGVHATLLYAQPPSSGEFTLHFYSGGGAPQGFRRGNHWYVNVTRSVNHTASASTEVCEGLIDPVGSYDNVQVGDPVAGTAYVPGTKDRSREVVHNFILPSWVTGGPGPWDWLELLPGPRTTTPGGIPWPPPRDRLKVFPFPHSSRPAARAA